MKCSDQKLIFNLLTPESVRDRCNEIFKIAKNDDLEHFQYHPKNFRFALEYVLEEFETRYPDGNIPLHSRWRHFEFGEQNLWQELFDHQSKDYKNKILIEDLQSRYKSNIKVLFRLNKDLISGSRIKIGSLMIDSSLKTKLNKITKNIQ